MASSPVITGAPSRASSNVVRLPTAAARKVQQPTPRRCGIAVAAGAAIRHPAKWQPAHVRAQRVVDDACTSLTRSPELALILAVLKSLPTDQAQKVRAEMAALAAYDSGPAARAAKVIAYSLLPIGGC